MSVKKTECITLKSNLVAKLILTILGSFTLCELMFWAGLTPHLLPGARPSSFTKWPLSQSLPKTWEGEILKVYPHLKYLWMCVSLFCWRQTQAEAAEQQWVAQNEWRKMCMGPILILLLGTAIGLYSCGARLWFLEKHTCTISKSQHHQH